MSRIAAAIALTALIGCGGGGDGQDRDRQDRDRLAPGADGQSNAAPRSVTVDESPRPELSSVRLLIVGYLPSQIETDRPAEGVVPPFFWVSPELQATWPLSFDAPIAPGLRLLAVRDIDGDGRPGPADRRSAIVAVPEDEGEGLAFVIDRDFLDGSGPTAAGDRDARPRPDDGSDPRPGIARVDPAPDGADPGSEGRTQPPPSGLLLQPAGMTLAPRTLRATSATPDRKPVPGQKLMIVGFPAGGLSDGLPVPGTKPLYFWNQSHTAADWPIVIEAVPLPTGLDVLVVLDSDGDGMPSPRDLASAPRESFVPPREGKPFEVLLDRQFAPEAGPDGDGGDGDGDDDDGGDGFGDDDMPDPGEAASKGALRPVNVDSKPRVPFLRNGVLMVVGYAPDDVHRGNPREGATPKFFWASADLQLTWPLQMEIPLPEGGLTMFVVLDLDADRRPSPGDLSSDPFVGFVPGDPGVDLEVTLRNSFGLAGPRDVPGTGEDDGSDGDPE